MSLCFRIFFLDDKYFADKNKTQPLNLRVKIEDYIRNDYITKEIPSEEGLGIAKSPEGPKLDPHF